MIEQVTMWQRSHDNKWSVCLLVKSVEHKGYLHKQRFTFDSFEKAASFVGALPTAITPANIAATKSDMLGTYLGGD